MGTRIVSKTRLGAAFLVIGLISFALAVSPLGLVRTGQALTLGMSSAHAAEDGSLTTAATKAKLTDQKQSLATAATKIKLRSKATVVKGFKYTMKLTGNTNKKVKWTSSNPKVAKIVKGTNSEVTVKGAKVGKATITAKVGGKKYKCSFKVIGTLDVNWIAVPMLDTKKLTLHHAKVKSWKSADPSIVKVNKKGVLTPGTKEGKTYVVCTDTLGNKYKCDVSVITPNIFCKMKKTVYSDALSTRYYFKQFFLYNGTPKTIELRDGVIGYFPFFGEGDTETLELLMATDGEVWGDPIGEDNAITLAPSGSKYFYAYEGDDYYSIREGAIIGANLTINGKTYSCMFKLGGTLDGNLISFKLAN